MAETESNIAFALERANAIYGQVGMAFVTNEPPVYFTNDDYFVLEQSIFPPYDSWPDLTDLISHTNGTGGLEVYFVNEIQGLPCGLCAASGGGIAIERNAPLNTMAHEIGHACGLRDIYTDYGGTNVGSALVREAWEPQDWSGGIGPEFYNRTLSQEILIRRLLMHGTVLASMATLDIPTGEVSGVKRNENGTNYVIGLTKVGFDNNGYPMNRTPKSN